ncbi:DNA primase family protein [Arsenophonus nasoniae]|uniref:Phage/plasmid primase, P4 family n=1 Tax=Arsenophonus nasoniae TaxID=638 RepID=A0AA95GB95_9GAMM|nr:phage/plasmid primase, P4 family [Arsenophonus nasoniae]WGL93759.1 phage/plasmid primase, P4 family [Arsenophonus nasoniae]WGL96029.1 phage/plasmid primase, P4 family [Arsenophonus nasoniae]
MKKAPNVKKLPKDPLSEAIIFAGDEAWTHAKNWQKGNPANDDIPPVVLAEKQLAELDNLIIVNQGQRYASVYRAGKLTEEQTTAIATKLALAGVKKALFYAEDYALLEDWTSQLSRLKSDAESGNSLVVQMPCEEINLLQMADNEKALLLAARYEGLAIHPDSEAFYRYVSGVWEKISPLELSREMGNVYRQYNTNFSKRTVNNVVEALKIIVPVLGEPCKEVIPFANGVFNIKTRVFSPHQPDNWLLNHNGIEYRSATPDEDLRDHAPNFHKWLSDTAGRDALKMQRILAALFMVLANRYDWQLFLEITGEGGSGKSVFTQIATLLAGQHNTASGNMGALDSARGRAQFVNKSMITLPDQPKYTGEGTGIKAITGGDAVEIDPKHEHQYTAILRTVVIATNNTPMIFTERAGGIARRRVIFQFNHRVKEEDKDPELSEKISAEIPVIVRQLLVNFAEPEKARRLLLAQRDSEEALEVKQNNDPLYAFCAHLKKLAECTGMLVGNRNMPFYPRIYVYHAYLSFLEANGFDKPMTLNKFSEGMKIAMREFNHDYRRERKTRGVVTNVELSESAEEWLPQTPSKTFK